MKIARFRSFSGPYIPEYGDLLSESSYSVQIRNNKD